MTGCRGRDSLQGRKEDPTACGTVETKTLLPGYQTNGEATFIRATAYTEKGDNGGPVFRQSTAFGITSGKTGAGHLIFQSTTYMPPGYSVVTGN